MKNEDQICQCKRPRISYIGMGAKTQNIGDKCDYCGKSIMMRRCIELWDKKKMEDVKK